MYNGLQLSLGRAFRGCRTRKAGRCRRKISRAKKAVGDAQPKARAQWRAAIWDQGWKISPSVPCARAGRNIHPRRNRRAGGHSANLDDPDRKLALFHFALLLGRRGNAVHPSARSGIFSVWAGGSSRRSCPYRSASILARRLIATGKCRSAKSAGLRWKTSATIRWFCIIRSNYTLTVIPDDAAYLHAQFPARQPASV